MAPVASSSPSSSPPTVAMPRRRKSMEAAATVRDLPPAAKPSAPSAPAQVTPSHDAKAAAANLSERRTDEWIRAINSGDAPFGTTRTHFHRVKDAVLAEAGALSTRAFPEHERQALTKALLEHDVGQLGTADLLRVAKQAAPTLTRQLRPDALERHLSSLAARLR